MKHALTETQIQLLERWFDGETTAEEARVATQLVASSAEARSFHEALKELRVAAVIAEEVAWEKAEPRSAAQIVSACEEDAELSLGELAPVLERFFDGECDDFEAEWVAELIDSRPDVADYLAGLEELRGGLKVSMAELESRAPLAGFWEGVESRLGTARFDRAEHAMLLQRYHDDEVTAEERALVESFEDPAVREGLAALAEVNLATHAALDHAAEGVDFSRIWAGVEAEMDAALEAQGDNVVALGRVRREQQEKRAGFSRQTMTAVAALVAAVLIGGLFGNTVFGPEKVIIEKTVVIVDSVEYAPGASVMIDSPVQQASAIANEGSETEEPTVIWILDEGDGTLEEVDSADEGESKVKKPIGQPI